MTDYEVRKISRQIEESPAGTELSGTTTTGIDNAMIAETEQQAMRALNGHGEELKRSIAAGTRVMAKEFARGRSDRAAMPAALADALAKPFDREACAEQFNAECG